MERSRVAAFSAGMLSGKHPGPSGRHTLKSCHAVTRGGGPQGQVLPPHVFVNVTNDMEVAQEEIFGPIGPIAPIIRDLTRDHWVTVKQKQCSYPF